MLVGNVQKTMEIYMVKGYDDETHDIAGSSYIVAPKVDIVQCLCSTSDAPGGWPPKERNQTYGVLSQKVKAVQEPVSQGDANDVNIINIFHFHSISPSLRLRKSPRIPKIHSNCLGQNAVISLVGLG